MDADTLRDLAADLRREADASTLDAAAMTTMSMAEIVQRARDIPHRVIVIGGVEIRIQFTRTTLPTRAFYHLSIGGPMIRYVPRELVDRIVAAFMGRPLPHRSVLGNCLQYLEEIKEESAAGR